VCAMVVTLAAFDDVQSLNKELSRSWFTCDGGSQCLEIMLMCLRLDHQKSAAAANNTELTN